MAEILSLMKAKLDASCSLLYETARFVDVYKALDDIAKERKLTPEERAEQKTFAKLADASPRWAKAWAVSLPTRTLRLYSDSRRFGLYERLCLRTYLP